MFELNGDYRFRRLTMTSVVNPRTIPAKMDSTGNPGIAGITSGVVVLEVVAGVTVTVLAACELVELLVDVSDVDVEVVICELVDAVDEVTTLEVPACVLVAEDVVITGVVVAKVSDVIAVVVPV